MKKGIFTKNFDQWLLILLILSLPFERLGTIDLFGYTLKFSYFFLIIIVGKFFFDYFKSKNQPIKLSPGEKCLLAFSSLNLLSSFWSIDPKRSIIIGLIFIFLALASIILKRQITFEKRPKFEELIINLSLIISIFGLWQFFAGSIESLERFSFLRESYRSQIFGFPRIQTTFLEPLYYANFLLFPILILIKKIFAKNCYQEYLKLILIVLTFFLTLSRGAIFSLLIVLIILSIFLLLFHREKLITYVKVTAAFFLAFIFAIFLVYSTADKAGVNQFLGHTAVNDVGTGESVIGRLGTASSALGTAVGHPFGLGAGAFGALPQFSDRSDYQIVNNLYLEILVESGIFGLVLFAGFLFLIFQKLWQNYRIFGFFNLFYLLGLLAIFIQYFSFSTIYIVYIWFFIALATVEPREPINVL
jgi:O-antigen ligase